MARPLQEIDSFFPRLFCCSSAVLFVLLFCRYHHSDLRLNLLKMNLLPSLLNILHFLSYFTVKTSAFTVGRFQVSPSKRRPSVTHQEPSPQDQAPPTTHSLPPSNKNQPEKNSGSSTEASQSESSNPTVTVSPLGNNNSLSDQEQKKTGSRRLSISLWEGPGCSQSWSRSATYSSDESEGEEMWEELMELRQR